MFKTPLALFLHALIIAHNGSYIHIIYVYVIYTHDIIAYAHLYSTYMKNTKYRYAHHKMLLTMLSNVLATMTIHYGKSYVPASNKGLQRVSNTVQMSTHILNSSLLNNILFKLLHLPSRVMRKRSSLTVFNTDWMGNGMPKPPQ